MEKNKKRWLITLFTSLGIGILLFFGRDLVVIWCSLFFEFITSIHYTWYIILVLLFLILRKSRRSSFPKPKSIKQHREFKYNEIVYEYSFPYIEIIYKRCGACNTILNDEKCPRCNYDYVNDHFIHNKKINPEFNIDDYKSDQDIIYLIEAHENSKK